jgi:NADH-quinone oxidoreductase subunit G
VNEEWISDKTRYAVDGLKRQRLDMPMARGPSGNLEPISWKAALELASSKLIATPGAKMAALAGPLVEVEALVALKDLFNSLGSTSTMSTVASLSADLRAAYTLNSTIAGLEKCDALLIVGSNLRIEAPLLNARVRKLVRHANLPVAMVGKPVDLTYEVEQLGDSAVALSDLLAGKGAFASTLKAAKKPAILVGTGALSPAPAQHASAHHGAPLPPTGGLGRSLPGRWRGGWRARVAGGPRLMASHGPLMASDGL